MFATNDTNRVLEYPRYRNPLFRCPVVLFDDGVLLDLRSVDSDRLQSWDMNKHQQAKQRAENTAPFNTHAYWLAYLREYYDNENILLHRIDGMCDASTGQPIFTFYYD